MQKSESVKELAAALAIAQGQVKPALKDSANPFFKSKYADFSSILDACEDALRENDIAIVQAPVSNENGAGVETMLMHSSGEWISETLILPVSKDDAQGMGSAITYARRYALEGFMRIRREDDDGNAAAKSIEVKKQAAMKILGEAAKDGLDALELAWKTLSNDMRKLAQPELARLKAIAERKGADRAAVDV